MRISDDFYDHPKFAEVTALGMGGWLVGLAYCNRNRTDGKIPRSFARRMVNTSGLTWVGRDADPMDAADELLEAGLWHEDGHDCPDCADPGPGAFIVHDYTVFQPSAEDIRRQHEEKSEAGRKGAQARWDKAPDKAPPMAPPIAGAMAPPMASGWQNDAPNPKPKPENKETSGKPDAPPRLDVEQVCAAVVAAEVHKGSKKPTVTDAWRTQARLMLDSDGRALADVLALVEWTRDHAFWRANIRSVPKLREQFDVLRLQRQDDLVRHPRQLVPGRDYPSHLPPPVNETAVRVNW